MDKNSHSYVRPCMAGTMLKRDIVAEEFEWKIEKFSSIVITCWSPEFVFQSKSWQFMLFPCAIDGYIQLDIIRSALGPPIAVKFSCALKTSDGHDSCERSGTEFFDRKFSCSYRMISISELERRQPELLSSDCLTFIIRMESVHFVEPAGRRHFFRSRYFPTNSSAPFSRETLPVATTNDAVKNGNASGEFEWKIEDFSLNEFPHFSPEFTLESERWEFAMNSKGDDGYINLDVRRLFSGSPILVEFIFALKTWDGQTGFEIVETEIFHEWKSACHYRWMKISEFKARQSEFLSSPCLTAVITVKTVDSVEPASESGRTLQPKAKILQDLKQMYLSEENKDVVLRVKGQEFSAHKNILMARSSVFASTFRNNMKEKKSGFVKIDDIEPSVFSDFLSFLYCEEIDNLCEENACNLFTAADKYDIIDLRSMCLDFMKQNLSVDRFCETLVLALLHNETDLVKACTDFFVRNAEEIIVSVKWQLFAAENPTQSNELFLKYVKSTKHSKQ